MKDKVPGKAHLAEFEPPMAQCARSGTLHLRSLYLTPAVPRRKASLRDQKRVAQVANLE